MAPIKNHNVISRSRHSSSPSKSPSSSASPTKQTKTTVAIFPHNHHYCLRSSDNVKRARKPIDKLNLEAPIVKKKEVRAGSGMALKHITAIRTAIREAEAAGLHYHLSVLHNLMYGFSGSSKTRVKNILSFSGYPAEVNRDTKLKTMHASEPLRYGNNYYVRLFLRLFGLETSGKKDELFDRFLDFMFHPN
eukprot:gene4770-5120_t